MLLKLMTMYPIYLTNPISDHMKTLKSNTMNMKKILLAGLILGGCCAPLSAQRTDTVRVYHQMLPEIKIITLMLKRALLKLLDLEPILIVLLMRLI